MIHLVTLVNGASPQAPHFAGCAQARAIRLLLYLTGFVSLVISWSSAIRNVSRR